MAKRVIELLEAYPKRKFFFAFGAGKQINHSCQTFAFKSTSLLFPHKGRVIRSILPSPQSHLFIFTGHFLGNNSVIAFMKEMGYDITHLPANHQIKRYLNLQTICCIFIQPPRNSWHMLCTKVRQIWQPFICLFQLPQYRSTEESPAQFCPPARRRNSGGSSYFSAGVLGKQRPVSSGYGQTYS